MNRSEIIQEIRIAAKERKTIIIKAVKKDGTITEREVEPYSFRSKDSEKLFYFFCWCLNSDGTRQFIVDNLIAANISENLFTPRFDIEM